MAYDVIVKTENETITYKGVELEDIEKIVKENPDYGEINAKQVDKGSNKE